MKQAIIAFSIVAVSLGTSFTALRSNNAVGEDKAPCYSEKNCLQAKPKQVTAPVTLLPLVNII